MKLSEVKAELERAFKETTDDPIGWLERTIREGKKGKGSRSKSPKILDSLLRVLKGATGKKPSKRKVTQAVR